MRNPVATTLGKQDHIWLALALVTRLQKKGECVDLYLAYSASADLRLAQRLDSQSAESYLSAFTSEIPCLGDIFPLLLSFPSSFSGSCSFGGRDSEASDRLRPTGGKLKFLFFKDWLTGFLPLRKRLAFLPLIAADETLAAPGTRTLLASKPQPRPACQTQ